MRDESSPESDSLLEIEAQETPNLSRHNRQLMAEAQHEAMLKKIRSWAYWLLGIGAISLIASGFLVSILGNPADCGWPGLVPLQRCSDVRDIRHHPHLGRHYEYNRRHRWPGMGLGGLQHHSGLHSCAHLHDARVFPQGASGLG